MTTPTKRVFSRNRTFKIRDGHLYIAFSEGAGGIWVGVFRERKMDTYMHVASKTMRDIPGLIRAKIIRAENPNIARVDARLSPREEVTRADRIRELIDGPLITVPEAHKILEELVDKI